VYIARECLARGRAPVSPELFIDGSNFCQIFGSLVNFLRGSRDYELQCHFCRAAVHSFCGIFGRAVVSRFLGIFSWALQNFGFGLVDYVVSCTDVNRLGGVNRVQSGDDLVPCGKARSKGFNSPFEFLNIRRPYGVHTEDDYPK
jgi:hypothetical protein